MVLVSGLDLRHHQVGQGCVVVHSKIRSGHTKSSRQYSRPIHLNKSRPWCNISSHSNSTAAPWSAAEIVLELCKITALCSTVVLSGWAASCRNPVQQRAHMEPGRPLGPARPLGPVHRESSAPDPELMVVPDWHWGIATLILTGLKYVSERHCICINHQDRTVCPNPHIVSSIVQSHIRLGLARPYSSTGLKLA